MIAQQRTLHPIRAQTSAKEIVDKSLKKRQVTLLYLSTYFLRHLSGFISAYFYYSSITYYGKYLYFYFITFLHGVALPHHSGVLYLKREFEFNSNLLTIMRNCVTCLFLRDTLNNVKVFEITWSSHELFCTWRYFHSGTQVNGKLLLVLE